MSQAGVIRSASQMSVMQTRLSLPEIQHPMSRLENPGNMDIRGVSRSQDRPFSQMSQGGRSLGCEDQIKPRTSFSAAGKRESRLSFRRDNYAGPPIDSIPEGVVVAQGDPNKPRMPIFGNRTSLGDRDDVVPPSRSSTRMSASSTHARLEIDELEAILNDKVRNSYREIKKRFKDNDPEAKGNVTREAFSRILVTILNRPLGASQMTRLVERLGMKDKGVISYTEFFAVFRVSEDRNYTKWMDPINRNDRVKMTASQIHAQLKEKARHGAMDISDTLLHISGGSGRILKPQFQQILHKMMFSLDEDEFEKLWNKYDSDGFGVIKSDQLMKKLGVESRNMTADPTKERVSPIAENVDTTSETSGQRTPTKREVERKQQLTIERWLKDKFREGFFDMKDAFENMDINSSGLVSYDDFLLVLQQYGLNLDKNLLGSFLSRCSVKTEGRAIPYREFLHRFQDRSEDGMVHNILTEPKHRFNKAQSVTGTSTISAIESQLMNMFQRDFLALLATLKNIDKLEMDRISLEEFRAAVETRFNLELTDEQFESFTERLPLDEDGMVIYGEFMKQFDTKGKAPSLFMGKKRINELPVTVGAGSPALPGEPMFDENPPRRRKTQELFKIIKNLLNRRYQDVEREFYDIDDTNTRRITPESMYHLLKRFDIRPEVSRGEIRDLWKTFITNSDQTLEYLQFVRHFGFSMRSAAYPNAKIRPPQHGDSDCMIRSRKLNSTRDLLEDHLRAKIEYMFEDLTREFQSMDVYCTGFISVEEFRDVLAELCIQLTDSELHSIVHKYNTRNDGRVSYVEFLKPFAWKQQTWRHGNDMSGILHQPQAVEGGETLEGERALYSITDKLRQRLAGDWKTLRRAFRKLDLKGDGLLSLPEFKSVLRLANVMLDEDEVFHVMSEFDKGMSGKISYDQFIQETIRPNTRLSVNSAK